MKTRKISRKQPSEVSIRFYVGSLPKLMLLCPEYGLVTAEAITLAQQLVNRQKTKTQLINDGFNRYSLNSKEGLPTWFLDDESKHYKPNIPITKEAVAALRAKQRSLDARPIKKVAEAKARKKFKAQQRLAKATKKAEGVNATSDMSEREKAQQIEKLLRKGVSKAKAKKEVKVVVAKGPHRGLKGRPKGVKGRYVMVDSRMKKEVHLIRCQASVPLKKWFLIGSSKKTEGNSQQETKASIGRSLSRSFSSSMYRRQEYQCRMTLVYR
jgi:hypothetical protein